MANGDFYRSKVGVVFTALRRSGGIHALDSMINFLLFSGRIVQGFPVLRIGKEKGDVD
jgi:hypothetical protein